MENVLLSPAGFLIHIDFGYILGRDLLSLLYSALLCFTLLYSALRCFTLLYSAALCFRYILGRDPKPMPPPFKLVKEMVDAMGGHQSGTCGSFTCLNPKS